MANIGTFSKSDDGFTGVINTLSVSTKAKLIAVEADGKNSPNFRVYAGNAELGAAWNKKSQAERPYISVKLDDPSLPAPIHASLHEGEDGQYNLIWTRRRAE